MDGENRKELHQRNLLALLGQLRSDLVHSDKTDNKDAVE